MTTVGFGDYFPRTHMGRFVIILASFWGVFLVSLMVVTLTNSSEFSIAEQNSFDILQRLKIKKKVRDQASRAVAFGWRNYRVTK